MRACKLLTACKTAAATYVTSIAERPLKSTAAGDVHHRPLCWPQHDLYAA